MKITVTKNDLRKALDYSPCLDMGGYANNCLIAQAGKRQKFRTTKAGSEGRKVHSGDLDCLMAMFDDDDAGWMLPMLEAVLPIELEV